MVYLVTCSFTDIDGNDNIETIGVFSSREKAEKAIDRCVKSFREKFWDFMKTYDKPGNYDITPYEIDMVENAACF